MPVSLICPTGHRLTVSRRYAGKLVRCPKCGGKVRVPPLETIERERKEQQEPETASTASAPQTARAAATVATENSAPRSKLKHRRQKNHEPVAPQPSAAPQPPEPPAPPAPNTPPDAGPVFEPVAGDNGEGPLAAPPVVAASAAAEVVAPPIESRQLETPSAPPQPPAEAIAPSPPASPAKEPAPEMSVRGYRPEPERRWTCLSLGIALTIVGVFGAIPAVLEIVEYARSDGTFPVARWAWLAMLAAFIQIGYAVYAAQLPDWSTAWVVTLVGAVLATFYAFLFGLTLVSGESSSVVEVLQLTDQVPEGKVTRWCFVMLGILGVYAYFAGRSALRWRHTFHLMRPMKEAKGK